MAGTFRPPFRLVPVLGMVVLALVLGGAATARAGVSRIGTAQSLPRHATVVGGLAAATRLRLTVTLQPQNPGALAAYAQAVSNPRSLSYHRYLSPHQFALRFGASSAQVAVVRRALLARGLRPGPVSAGHLSIAVTASAAAVEHGLSVSLLKLALAGRRSAIAASAAPALSTNAAHLVQSIVGLNTVSAPHPLLVRASSGDLRPLAARASGRVVTGGPQPCSQASAAASSQGAYTADQLASAYGFSGLYGAGDRGAGVTVAIYELEPDLPSDIAAYQACYGTHASVSYVPVDGGAGSGPGTGEAALDIEDLIGLAPDANVLVYQGPNSNSGAPGSGPYDTFSAIINQDRASVVTVSWGECESTLGAGNAKAENTLFEQAAIEGQSIVAASGDSGAEDCDSAGGLPQIQAAVDDPSSQAYVTGVGGTTLKSLGPPPEETVWNSGGSLAAGLLAPGAGGGGISSLWSMPADQLDAAPSLNVLGAGRTGAQCGHPGGYCREVPDVSADADPATGYTIYWNGDGSDAGQPSGWQAIGGTSAAAPLWAALLTLTDASKACAKSPVGFAGPALYRAASTAYGADFNDVRSGNNDFTGTNGGRYAAGPGYDEATGLGTPKAAALAAGLCTNAVRLTNPGARRSAARTNVSLRLRATDAQAATLDFRAAGLPPGLALNPLSGRISGQPRRAGVFKVAVDAEDAEGSAATTSFSWTIGGAPRIADVRLIGLSQRRPRLSFTVTTGRDAPELDQLTVTLPAGLRVTSTKGVKIAAQGNQRPSFATHLTRGKLEIKLRHSLPEVQVTLAYPALRSATAVDQAHHSSRAAAQLIVGIVDASAGTTSLRSALT